MLQTTPRYYWPSGDRVPADRLTPAQVEALEKLASRFDLYPQITLIPCGHGTFGVGGAVLVKIGRVIYGVEPDGYVHT